MKSLRSIIACISLVSIMGCDKQISEDLNVISVNQYIELLKNGKYDSFDLPEFTYKDIPALLEYKDEPQTITGFPRNAISSYGQSECNLGIYVLWTIESIRAVSIDSEYLIGRFPSQNPILQQKEEPFDLEFGSKIQEIVSKAYFDWWEDNKNINFDNFKNIDPLSNSKYEWH